MRFVLRRSLSFLALAALLLSSTWAHAAPRDKAALKKIDEAINTNFLNMDFDAAEGLLLGTIRACEDKCSAEVMGKAWMYVGIVRGSGRNDMKGAEEAFRTAVSSDPNVQLDSQVASDPVKAAFAKVKGSSSSGPAETTPPPSSGGGTFTCAPSPSEIETRRPVPLSCETEAEIANATIHYKTFDGGWATVKMEPQAGAWRGTIPCAATQNTGKLKYYVDGTDSDGEVVAKLGDKGKPNTADVVSETSADPPAFPEEEPPARCSVESTSDSGGGPKAGGGEGAGEGGACGGWGQPACDTKCESDSDCQNGGSCNDGKCEGGGSEGGGDKDKDTGPGAPNWLGLNFGFDLASISHDGACRSEARKADHIACFYSNGATYQGTPSDAAPGRVAGGFAPATMRLMASYERLFGALGVAVRLGFAFNGGSTPQGGSAFLPFHGEIQLKYWLRGASAFSKKGFRPWVHIGGGVAEYDTKVPTDILDCQDPNKVDACQKATDRGTAEANGAVKTTVTATKQLGLNFVTAGGGFMYAISKNHGPVLNVDLVIPFGATGFVIEPSLGYQFGF
jgi:hypothetical protein